MSLESARAFASKMKEDETFRKSFIETGSKEKAMELVKARGYDFSLDEINQVRAEHTASSKESTTLSDADLDKVAGGYCGCGWCWGND